MFDRDMRYVAASERWLRDYGIREDEVIGKSHYDLFPELPETWRDVHRRALAGEVLSGQAEKFERADGSVQWVSWETRPWFQSDGAIGGIVISAEDVTAQVRERELFRTLVDNLPELAWMSQPDGHIDFYNRRWYEYTGTTFEEMEGWGWEKVHHPEMLPMVVERWKQSLATGEPFEMEFPLRGADGVFRWFLTRIRPLRDPAGRIVRWFGTNTNVDEVRRARERLAASERKFSIIFERAPFAVCFSEMPSGKVVDVNPAFVEMFGFAKAELVGKTGAGLGMEADLAARERMQQQFLRDGFVRGVETRLQTKSGALRTVVVTVDAIALDGKSYALTTLEDITERQRTEAELQRAKAEAETANLAKDEFLAMLGHELRNPLAPIQTALQLMRLRGSPSAERERAVIERQVRHMVRLVDDLLDISRITRGRIELARERVDLAEVAARAIEIASPLLEQHRHSLSAEVERGLVVIGDADRLTQVMANLLTNAAKYTPAGGQITVVGERRGSRVALHVRDTGVGISAEMQPRIFDLFVQGRQGIDRKEGGLGLGLSIVRRIVELHDGHVAVDSEGIGRGTTFTVDLPAAEAGTAVEIGAPDVARQAPEVGHRRRILVVDDNQDAAELLAESLQALGYVTRVANDGPSALDAASAFHPHIGLLDIGLPVMDGYELARRLRDSAEGAKMRLIAVTGYGQDSDRRRAREAGFDEHLIKPVDINRLAALLDPPTTQPA